jgi:peptidoglycan lytic transglycosylase
LAKFDGLSHRSHRKARSQPLNSQQRRIATGSLAAAILIGGAAAAANVSAKPAVSGVAAPSSIAEVATSDASVPPSPSPDATVEPTPTSKTTPAPRQTSTAASRSNTRTEKVVSTGSCGASFYDEPQMTANGETFNPDALTAASKTIAFDTRVRVTSVDTGRSVIVRINDRGPYISGRCLDLSRAAFDAIDNLGKGAVTVKYEILG